MILKIKIKKNQKSKKNYIRIKKTKEEHEKIIANMKNDDNKQIETIRSDSRAYERLILRKKHSAERETKKLQDEIEKLKKQYEEEKEQEKKNRIKEEQIKMEEKKNRSY